MGDPWGDPRKPGSGDPAAYFLYFPDNGTFGREELEGRTGFWLRGGEGAEVFLRAMEPVVKMTILVTGGPAGDEVSVGVGKVTALVPVRPGETRNVILEPASGFPYKDTFVHVLTLRSRKGGVPPGAATDRVLGSFVSASLDVEKRPPH